MKVVDVMNLFSSSCKPNVFLAALFLLHSSSYISPAQGDSPPKLPQAVLLAPQEVGNGHNPLKSRQHLEQYLKDKYRDISDVETRVTQTPNGPAGEVQFRGIISPRKITEIDLSVLPDRHSKSRAIAKAFMEDEYGMLGINKPEELRVSNISTWKGGDGDLTDIYYKKYINDIEFQGSGILITVGPDYDISSVSATLTPVLPEVYEATKKKSLTEEELKTIIEKDVPESLKQTYKPESISKHFKKYAIAKPPYVIWDAFYYYFYEIDAFTGKILSKRNPITNEEMLKDSDKDSKTHHDIETPMPPPVLPQK